MHESVRAWVAAMLDCSDVVGGDVLEVGSYNVNGTVRPLIEACAPATYLGVDQRAGRNVDRVVAAGNLLDVFGPDSFDVVISTEMLEHVDDWRNAVEQMAAVTRLDGLLVLTTRSEGFPYHPHPVDRWRFSVEQMGRIVEAAGCDVLDLRPDPQYPGVFCEARRMRPVSSLEDIEVGVAIPNTPRR